MKSIQAVIAGSLFIIIASLFMQLAYVLIAVEYNSLAKDYPVLNEIRGVFRYLVALPVFMLIMFLGGYITAFIIRKKVLLHCLVVGAITAGGMLGLALANMQLTLTGMVIFVVTLATTLAGGLYWQGDDKTLQAEPQG